MRSRSRRPLLTGEIIHKVLCNMNNTGGNETMYLLYILYHETLRKHFFFKNNQEVRLSDSFGVVTGVILGLLFDC